MRIAQRLSINQIWQRAMAPSTTCIFLLLFVIFPFIEYCFTRASIVHYYLGDGIGNYIGLTLSLWAATSVLILLHTGILKIITLLFLAISVLYYCLYFPYSALSILIALGLVFLVKLDRRTTFVANSFVFLMALVILLYAVFGVHSNHVGSVEKPINTVILVFDEFSLEQVGGYRQLEDKKNFPNFSKLMENSDVYYNAITSNLKTERAVPSIVAGRHANVLGAGFYLGDSLFEIFKKTHDTHIVELVSTFENKFSGNFLNRIGNLIKQYKAAKYATPMTDVVRDLADISKDQSRFTSSRSSLLTSELFKSSKVDNRPFFYFHHLLAPHRPYQWNGMYFYNQNNIADSLYYSAEDKNSDSLANMSNLRARYIDQLKRMDWELGRLIDALHAAKVYDETAIIITSDHGISFTPRKSARMFDQGNEGPIQLVPLIVKKGWQNKRHNHFELISNLSVNQLSLDANGGFSQQREPITGYPCFGIFNCNASMVKDAIASNVVEYDKRLMNNGEQFDRHSLPEQVQAMRIKMPDLSKDVSDYVEVELGDGNLDSVKVDSKFYPFNLVFSIHGNPSLGSIIYAFVDNKPCGSIDLDKIQEKYSIYCSLPFPRQAVHVDFYLHNGSQLSYLPKKLGYAHFSSSKFSGKWREIRNAAPPTYISSFSGHLIYWSANHREIIFVDRKTGNIDQRVAYHRDFDFDAVHLYDINFLLTSKTPGKVLVFNYQK